MKHMEPNDASPTLKAVVVSGRPRTAAHRLAEANRRLIYGVMRRKFPFLFVDERFDDAYISGYLGLLGAAERFDASRGFEFSTYATPSIYGGILRFLQVDGKQARLDAVSLDVPIGDDGGYLGDMIPDPASTRPYAAVVNAEGLGSALTVALGKLTPHQQEAVKAVHFRELSARQFSAESGIYVDAYRCGMVNLRKDRQLLATVFG